MRRERGFGTGDLLLWGIVVVAVVGILWALYAAIDNRGYARGRSETQAEYAKRDNEALEKANLRVQELEQQARALEEHHVAQMAAIDGRYQEDLKRETEQKERALEQLRAGTLQLRDPGATRAACSAGSPGGEGCIVNGEMLNVKR